MNMENGDTVRTSISSDKKDAKKRSNPNILSKIFIWWICPVLIKGNKRDVEEDDLIVPSKKYDAKRLGDSFERYWLDEYDKALNENRKPSLWKTIWRAYWLEYMLGGLYIVTIAVCRNGSRYRWIQIAVIRGYISLISRSVEPMMFANLLSYWSSESTMTQLEAAYYGLAMLGLNFISMMCQHHNTLFVQRFSLRIKVACSELLYRKLLRMSQVSLGDLAGGKLVNLLTNDIARFDYGFMFLHYLWVVPVQLAVVLYFLYNIAGYAPIVGLFSVVLIIMPLQGILTNITGKIRREVAQRSDTRIKMMSEIINGIQVIKMYAWEKPFQAVVSAVRAFEIKALRKALFVRSFFLGFSLFTERSILFFTTLVLLLSGTMVTATTIYPIQQYLGIIQMNLTLIIPLAIASLSELLVSFERIKNFLMLDEREDLARMKPINNLKNHLKFNGNNNYFEDNNISVKRYSQTEETSTPNADLTTQRSVEGDIAVDLNKVSASWTIANEPSEMTLKNISLRLRRGKLCAIIGPVGSGKSSLLQVLLKELPISSGSVNIQGKVSYACQESWLFPATVRENIIFGSPYISSKYNEVCRVCSLLPDFKQFPYGDQSLVGERGVSLSGGQRARINLARAIYREADIYLLDDPLSAVDANVGRQLFESCITGYLRERTVVLVTHQIHFISAAHQIVVLNEGSIENIGSYNELAQSGKEFSLLLAKLTEIEDPDGQNKETARKRPSMQRGMSVKSDGPDESEKAEILEAEGRAKGNLKWSIIGQYLSSVNSWCLVVMVPLALLFSQAPATFSDYWLSFWTNQVSEYEIVNGELPDTAWNTQIGPLTNTAYIAIYGGIILTVITFLVIRISIFVAMTVRASQNIHNYVFKNLISAVMRFFDTNPSGRVLNRFSKDLGAMDELMPRSMLETIQMYLSMISILVLNAIALPWTLIPTFCIVILFVILLRWYLNAAQAVKRLEGTTKSPVLGMISSTMQGLSTIRSSNSQGKLLKSFNEAQDLHSSAFYTYLGGTSAFGMYLDGLCLVYLGIIIAIFLIVDFGDIIPVGSVGLAVSQSMMLTMMLQLAARFTADFLAQMTAVERVLEYSKLPKEENIDEGPIQPPVTWPMDGHVEFKNVFLSYSLHGPPVLKNLNFEIASGWKVGVVGRTGAGKSSLLSALFHLTPVDGSIKIDGIDTNSVAKQTLRSKISIIPQEPVLFSASLRYNLDPFNVFSDHDIWRVLEQVELKDVVPALEFKVSESGSNFSVGQRQLICLARALLRSNKLLVMDEATANVDPQTDALIQETIRREFASCTVITIAHRLNTIMDSDRVLVMDKGEVVEYDYPYVLLLNPDSKFSAMVRETGTNMSKNLFEVAKQKYESDKVRIEKVKDE